jgi:hypothetical protein
MDTIHTARPAPQPQDIECGEFSPLSAGDLSPSNRHGCFSGPLNGLCFADESAKRKSGDKSPHSKSPPRHFFGLTATILSVVRKKMVSPERAGVDRQRPAS